MDASILRAVQPTVRRFVIATTSLVIAMFIGSLHRQRPPAEPKCAALPAALPKPTSLASVKEDPDYPEDLDTEPYTIANYLRDNPNGKLEKLWRRLNITGADPFFFNSACGDCEVNTFSYNLSNESAGDVVLQIKERFQMAYRYLIFTSARSRESRFIGHVDVRTKYPPNEPVVLLSNGRPWLIIQETAATGSGLAAWEDTVYDVSNGRVIPVATYLAGIDQMGELGLPWKEVTARPVSCELKQGRAILTLSYRVEYSMGPQDDLRLFTKVKTAVLIGSPKSKSTYVDAAHSEITPHEFETIYNFDSMTPDDFLQYNRSELRAIASGKDSQKKTWLREFLDTCKDSAFTRELYSALN